jgi:hypothetical protein
MGRNADPGSAIRRPETNLQKSPRTPTGRLQ